MRRLLFQELRGLVGCWPLWILPLLAAVVGWAMLPVNADAYRTYIYRDPQGPDQELEAFHTDVFAVYTSGLGWAQLLAMVVGAFLVLRDRRLTCRPTPLASVPDPGPLIVAKAAVAALFAVVLAAADLAVVLPNGQTHLTGHEPRLDGGAVHQLTLADGSVWTVVLCAVADVSLFAVIGVGLAARAGRWWLAGVTAGVLSLASLLFMAKDPVWESIDSDAVQITLYVLFLVVAVPASPLALLWLITLSVWAPLAVALTLALAVSNILLGYDATRRRNTP